MAGILWTRTSREPTGTLTITCPACKAEDVEVETYTQSEQLLLALVLPLTPVNQTHWMNCTRCNATIASLLPGDELRNLPPELIAKAIRHRVSPICKLLAVLAILLFFMPLLGLMVTVPAALANFRQRGWTRTVSLVALVLSVIVHLIWYAAGIFSHP